LPFEDEDEEDDDDDDDEDEEVEDPLEADLLLPLLAGASA
jgi:hypothetical protein